MQHSAIDVRWKNRVTDLEQRGNAVALTVETPDVSYHLTADYVVACRWIAALRALARGMMGWIPEARHSVTGF